MVKLHASVKRGGNFKINSELRSAIYASMAAPTERAAMIVQGGIQAVTPVREGTLRRSWNTGSPKWEGDRLLSKVGTPVVYARSVNERGKSAGYVRKGLSASQSRALSTLRDGAKAIHGLWKRG